jgi:energy-coupling factor transporter transmembrane protein EcfT
MRDAAPIFCYRYGDTPIHRFGAAYKLFATLLSTIGVFLVPIPYLLLFAILLLVLSFVSHMSAKSLLRNLFIAFRYAAFIFAFRFIGKPLSIEAFLVELRETAIYSARLALVLFVSSIFFETTSSLEIRRALTSIQSSLGRPFSPFRRYIEKKTGKRLLVPDIAFLLSLTISFIPRIILAWSTLNLAWDARGGNRIGGSRGFWKRCVTLTPLLISKLLTLAVDTDRSIRNRS